MPNPAKPKLPPIAVEDKAEKISLSLSAGLHKELEQFSDFFLAETGQKPSSLNAVIVGVITRYLDDNRGFQKWRKNQPRSARGSA